MIPGHQFERLKVLLKFTLGDKEDFDAKVEPESVSVRRYCELGISGFHVSQPPVDVHIPVVRWRFGIFWQYWNWKVGSEIRERVLSQTLQVNRIPWLWTRGSHITIVHKWSVIWLILPPIGTSSSSRIKYNLYYSLLFRWAGVCRTHLHRFRPP